MEQRQLNALIAKAGGNASANALTYRMNIPVAWAKQMGITPDDKALLVSFDGEKITIEKD